MKRLAVFSGMVLGLGLIVSTLFLSTSSEESSASEQMAALNTSDSTLAIATLAGGCFWCVEAAFEKVPGVVEVISGYTGGEETFPTYRQVASGATGHTEAVQIHYDESVITYEGLLATLWRTANPTDNSGQYVDRGKQYRPEIFYHNEAQQAAAVESTQALNDSGRYKQPVVIGITAFTEFYAAEDYHQDYYKKNPVRYKLYTRNSGRYQFIDSVWPEGRSVDYTKYKPELSTQTNKLKVSVSMNQSTESTDVVNPFNADTFVKPSDAELKQRLSALEYKVTQREGTERPFFNAMHDETRAGLYVDIVSGEPLFSSSDKYDSKTGWPSFDRPIAEGVLVEKVDRSLFGVRTEIRSAVADSHLGHVFNDGPAPTGMRYCMNSAAMRFIPVDQMASQGYANYIDRVSQPTADS